MRISGVQPGQALKGAVGRFKAMGRIIFSARASIISWAKWGGGKAHGEALLAGGEPECRAIR